MHFLLKWLLLGFTLVHVADCCFRKIEVMTENPMPLPTTSRLDSWSNCTVNDTWYDNCHNGGVCEVKLSLVEGGVQRISYCRCGAEFQGKGCNFPVLPSVGKEASVNIALGVLIGTSLLALIVIVAVVYNKHRNKGNNSKYGQHSGYNPQDNGEDLNKYLLPNDKTHQSTAPLAEVETLDSCRVLTEQPAIKCDEAQVDNGRSNNNAGDRFSRPGAPAPLPASTAHITDSSIPTPLVDDFKRFGFDRDGKSLRNSTGPDQMTDQNYMSLV